MGKRSVIIRFSPDRKTATVETGKVLTEELNGRGFRMNPIIKDGYLWFQFSSRNMRKIMEISRETGHGTVTYHIEDSPALMALRREVKADLVSGETKDVMLCDDGLRVYFDELKNHKDIVSAGYQRVGEIFTNLPSEEEDSVTNVTNIAIGPAEVKTPDPTPKHSYTTVVEVIREYVNRNSKEDAKALLRDHADGVIKFKDIDPKYYDDIVEATGIDPMEIGITGFPEGRGSDRVMVIHPLEFAKAMMDLQSSAKELMNMGVDQKLLARIIDGA